MTANDWIDRLGLEPHPEGGYFRETYRSPISVPREALPKSFGGRRPVATSIYFLLTHENFSAFHRLRSDEVWHFHAGNPLTLHILGPDGTYRSESVGLDPDGDTPPQRVVPAGCWFASAVEQPGGFALVGCTVAPGFDFEDFELARRDDLLKRYPEHAEVIRRLTR